MGQPEQDCQHSPLRTVLLGKDIQSKTARTGQLGQIARKGMPEQDSPNGTSKTGEEDDGMQIRNAQTDCQNRLQGQYCHTWLQV